MQMRIELIGLTPFAFQELSKTFQFDARSKPKLLHLGEISEKVAIDLEVLTRHGTRCVYRSRGPRSHGKVDANSEIGGEDREAGTSM